MDTLDYQTAFLAGLRVMIEYDDGERVEAETEEDIANADGIAEFSIIGG